MIVRAHTHTPAPGCTTISIRADVWGYVDSGFRPVSMEWHCGTRTMVTTVNTSAEPAFQLRGTGPTLPSLPPNVKLPPHLSSVASYLMTFHAIFLQFLPHRRTQTSHSLKPEECGRLCHGVEGAPTLLSSAAFRCTLNSLLGKRGPLSSWSPRREEYSPASRKLLPPSSPLSTCALPPAHSPAAATRAHP